jgi:hypothetical protein
LSMVNRKIKNMINSPFNFHSNPMRSAIDKQI